MLISVNRSSAGNAIVFGSVWLPKVSLHINALMHSANRAAAPIAPGVMHYHAEVLPKAIEYSAAFSRCRRRAYYPFHINFHIFPLARLCLGLSVCQRHQMPLNGVFLSSCFHPKQILACEPYSSRHNKLCAVWNTGPGRQAARRAMCRKMSVARQLSFSLSLPRSGRLLLYSPSIKNSHCQALLQPRWG